jgi:hypothetical protein
MASGILGKANLSATTNTTVYTVPADKTATVNVSFCNRTNQMVTVRLAMSATGTPGNDEWLEYDAVIDSNGVLERTGLVLDATKQIVAYSSAAGVTVMAYGFEE